MNDEGSQPFVWPKIEQFPWTGRKYAGQPTIMVRPHNLCMFPKNNPVLLFGSDINE